MNSHSIHSIQKHIQVFAHPATPLQHIITQSCILPSHFQNERTVLTPYIWCEDTLPCGALGPSSSCLLRDLASGLSSLSVLPYQFFLFASMFQSVISPSSRKKTKLEPLSPWSVTPSQSYYHLSLQTFSPGSLQLLPKLILYILFPLIISCPYSSSSDFLKY